MCCCVQAFLKQGEAVWTRCDELQSLVKRGCDLDMIESPKGEMKTLRNKAVTKGKKPEEIIQIQPQKISLTLRSGTGSLSCGSKQLLSRSTEILTPSQR